MENSLNPKSTENHDYMSMCKHFVQQPSLPCVYFLPNNIVVHLKGMGKSLYISDVFAKKEQLIYLSKNGFRLRNFDSLKKY